MRTYARRATSVGVDSPLNSHRFVQMLAARLTSNIAVNALHYALLIAIVQQTGSTVHSALLVLTFTAPGVLVGMVAGVAVDRLSRRMILIAAHILRAFAALALFRFAEDVWAIYAISVAFSAVNPFAAPAEYAVLPGLVGNHRLTSGHAWFNLMSLVGQAAGIGVIAPLFLKTSGPEPVYLTAAILYFAAAILVLQMGRLSRAPVAGAHDGRFTDVREQFMRVWHFLRSDRPSYLATIETSVVTTAVLVTVSILPAYTEDVLGVPADNAVFVTAPAVLGMALGLRLVSPLAAALGNGVVVSGGFALLVAGALVFGFIEPLTSVFTSWSVAPDLGPLPTPPEVVVVAMLLAIPVGFAHTAVAVAARAVLQQRAPEDLQGRVFAAQGVIASLGSIAPLLLGGLLGELVGVQFVMILIAVSSGAVGILTRIGDLRGQSMKAAQTA